MLFYVRADHSAGVTETENKYYSRRHALLGFMSLNMVS